ncbi:MAG TPA: metal-dependent transcriptional regulator [Bryobacteraceae bacterium]|nr:metal-dependent transcriptional regulator [Bryobacteraceae bacterium]
MKTKSLVLSTSESVDDYLKAILELGGSEEQKVSSNALAQRLNVRAASVTGMLQRLAAQRPPLVLYERHHGARLTMMGKRRAWELVRHHRLLELFLHDVLKYSWDEVHEEAERLEHFISERFEDRVAAILGDPEIDPHGHFIPQKNEAGSFQCDVPLNELPFNVPAKVSSVFDRDAAALREIERMGIRLGVTIVVERRNSNTSMTARIQGHRAQVRIAKDLAENIFVRPCVAH